MSWNVQGLISKLNDEDFLNFINSYDVLIFSETWNSKNTNVNLDKFESFSCPRPKCNRKVKRNSGGVIIYYKKLYSKGIALVKQNNQGIIWFKLKKTFFGTENDVNVCSCYIPPNDSSVDTNENSPLYEFYFFEHLAADIRCYSQLGILC